MPDDSPYLRNMSGGAKEMHSRSDAADRLCRPAGVQRYAMSAHGVDRGYAYA